MTSQHFNILVNSTLQNISRWNLRNLDQNPRVISNNGLVNTEQQFSKTLCSHLQAIVTSPAAKYRCRSLTN